MPRRRDYIKPLIAGNFKQLLMEYPFEKITVQMLSDRTGIIRSTFYHHFKDKFDVLDWIIQEELVQPARKIFQQNQIEEALKWMLNRAIFDFDFYRKAARITGKNGFEDVIYYHISELFCEEIQRQGIQGIADYPLLDAEILAQYYAHCFIYAI